MEFENTSSSHAFKIWQSGVDAVRADRLVADALQCEGNRLTLGDAAIDIGHCGKIVVVGGGKGAAQMAAAVEQVLGPQIVAEKVFGWVNVPADCLGKTQKIHLHAARPAGVNEPTPAGVVGSEKILDLVSDLQKDDLCLALLTGGGSALLPAPRLPITLEDLLEVTRLLMNHGATINELNTVRTCLSRIKGGGLARACRGGTLWSLIISDVVGDPPSMIASGPTVLTHSKAATNNMAEEALHILHRIDPHRVPNRVIDFLTQQSTVVVQQDNVPITVINQIIGNNAVALRAAAKQATQLGYKILSLGSDNQGEASEEGRTFAVQCRTLQQENKGSSKRLCILSGGEPVVDLSPQPGKGGRNQQFVLAALAELFSEGMHGITILSGGTDGEDGPTDAAGAVADRTLVKHAQREKMNPREFLTRHDAYRFFESLGGLLRTGPTHTNVMDVRVALVEQLHE